MHLPVIDNLFERSIFLDNMLDEIPVAIVVLDLQRRIVSMNRAVSALTGYSLPEAKGITCHNIVRGSACINSCPLPHIKKDSEPVCVQSDLINREHERIPIRVTLAPLVDADGNLAGYLETMEDIRLLRRMDEDHTHAFAYSAMIGKSEVMSRVFQMLPLIALNDSSVLITGETGTGKDLAAEEIHEASNRAKGPFIKINCGALPETLLESELFGHQKGAFTGAMENKPGRFRLAQNGTLFLTEIGDLPLSLQIKLLTFLDDRIIYPLGSTKGFELNVRVIAGTHRNLEKMVSQGRFRKDLLFRLNVVRMHLPPLRERGEDIRLLIDHFAHHFIQRFNKSLTGFTKDALALLMGYQYPGNVRELRNIIEYAVNVSRGPKVDIPDLPTYLTDKSAMAVPLAEEQQSPDGQNSSGGPGETRPMIRKTGDNWAETEKQMILDALVQAGGRRSKAASILGWGRSTLWRKMKQYNLG